jgi:hypothetical protein
MKLFNKLRAKLCLKLMSKAQKEMISLSAQMTIHYTESRKFRREMDSIGFGTHIRNSIKAWD